MEQLYKEGKFINNNGKIKLEFDREKTNIRTEIMFKKSLSNVIDFISCYDFNKIKDIDYYYLYNKKIGKIKEEDIEKNFLLNPITNNDNTVFWDVLNNIIFVKGKDNLKLLCIELEWLGYAKYGLKFSDEKRKINFIMNQKNPSLIIKKISE